MTMIKVYFIAKKQFIGEIQVDENSIMIWCDDYTDYDYHDKKTIEPSFNGTYMFREWVWIEKELDVTYYDINHNPITNEQFEAHKLESAECFNCDRIGNTYLYKSMDVVVANIIYYIYFTYRNNIKYITPTELFVEPVNNTGIIKLYDDYGDLKTEFFHINGKINGDHHHNYYNNIIEKTTYVDGLKQGASIKYQDGKIIERKYYLNNMLISTIF